MKRSVRMQKLQTLARDAEQREAQALARCQQALDSSLTQLQDLRRYRDEYRDSMSSRCGHSVLRWQEYHRFLERLDKAIHAQERSAIEAEVSRDKQRREWTAKRQRMESLSRLVDRHGDEERRQDDRREQQRLDAMASAAAFRRGKG